MRSQRITLVQTIGNLGEFYEFREKNAIPLVLGIEKNQIDILKIKSFDHSPSSFSVSYLYQLPAYYDENQKYTTLRENALTKLIQTNQIYIPEFIDLDANRRYIDYILHTDHSVHEDSREVNPLCADFRHKILFRDRRRLFERLGTNYDFVRGQFKENPNTRNLSDLWMEILKNTEKVEENKEKIKALFY